MPPRARKPINDSPSVSLNLDTLEREGASPEPFSFVLKGNRYVMGDVQDIDWQKLLEAQRNPIEFFRVALVAKDVDAFFETGLAAWKLQRLIASYMQHYGMPAVGEVPALPTS